MPPNQPPQINRMDQLRLMGANPDLHFFVLNMQHAYQQWLLTLDHTTRKDLWRSIHLMALDLSEITSGPCPDILEDGAALYKQLEQG